ncbi:conserved hypothetical protein [Candidatus Phytoplasma mali]|uniref:Uncharacterized protein n=1 Tax=Phytoplasma mali (strain AT) TaxID=482235 RepID=B3QZP1_PHYMT|nr:hypothetical protein [Candidatus Phytoplasma mali]CAP18428.1 conserved hypothetical protein [Candidatus Phytoplasma mali]
MEWKYFLILFFLVLLIIILMDFCDKKIWFYKLKKYLTTCSSLEQEILKTFCKEPNTVHKLNDKHKITHVLSNLFIIIKYDNNDDENINLQPQQSFYYINPKVYKLMKKYQKFKKIYFIN